MLQCEAGEERKVTVHVQKKEQLRCEMEISYKKQCIIKLFGFTTCGSSAAVAITSQITPLRISNAVR